jgi:hypothetical protein
MISSCLAAAWRRTTLKLRESASSELQMSLRLDATSGRGSFDPRLQVQIGATAEQLPQRCGNSLDQETAGFVGTNLRIRSAFPCVIFSKSS